MRAIVLLATLLALMTSGPARADDADTWAALRAGGVVALMRHANAPGVGDPPGFAVGDCATQRNLDATGRADAQAVGERFRVERVAVTQVLSSPWCRCLDTARLMALGPVQPSPAFASAFTDRRADEIAEAARGVIRAWKGPGTLLVVTHAVNIQALTGFSPGSGEIVVVAADAAGGLKDIGRLRLPPR